MITNTSKGQVTIEYILMVTAVIIVAIYFMFIDGSMFKQRLNATYDLGAQAAKESVSQFTSSLQDAAPAK